MFLVLGFGHCSRLSMDAVENLNVYVSGSWPPEVESKMQRWSATTVQCMECWMW